ncbi:uncharacterized protein H6S33_010999 [Morchella sextelata]|uniref:uncharacterized protein n=1 Tax=Morchella sextelata TaxID=1174677 RepID=UPI001D054F12|nr:uncharacterized protein H6S33_010999 [Morchella sextelata]KAH0611734.1 hypothetical protein H6S33_010999 [Morchella sextelata]
MQATMPAGEHPVTTEATSAAAATRTADHRANKPENATKRDRSQRPPKRHILDCTAGGCPQTFRHEDPKKARIGLMSHLLRVQEGVAGAWTVVVGTTEEKRRLRDERGRSRAEEKARYARFLERLEEEGLRKKAAGGGG